MPGEGRQMTTVRKRLIQEPERVNPIEHVHIWRTPAGSSVDMLIVAHLSAYSAIHHQAAASLPNETGGFLVGRVACDQRGCWHVEIEQAVPVEPTSQNPVHFTFTWRDVDRVRSYREGHGKALLGWYHTHPDLGIFLSETDLERTHRVLFSEPFQIALVYDPVRGRAGYFFWESPQCIDAAPAEWREFDILVTPDATPLVSDPAPPVASDSLAPAVVPAAAAAGQIPNGTELPAISPAADSPSTDPLVAEAEIATAPMAPINPVLALSREPSGDVGTAVKSDVTRTQRLRQPVAPTPSGSIARHAIPTAAASRTDARRDPDLDADPSGGARSKGVLLVGAAVILVVVVLLMLWLSVT
jgi:proteasome lid subunit RPN8/RPN11